MMLDASELYSHKSLKKILNLEFKCVFSKKCKKRISYAELYRFHLKNLADTPGYQPNYHSCEYLPLQCSGCKEITSEVTKFMHLSICSANR